MTIERNHAVDMIRATALIGIAVVNLPYMALPEDAAFNLPDSLPDRIAILLVQMLFEAKFFLLFSFIFGWGMEIQALSAARSGASFARRFSRRLAALAAMGVMHALLVFSGDILLLYSILGIAAWVAKPASVRSLLKTALVLVLAAPIFGVLIGLLLSDAPASPAIPNLGGSFLETVQARWRDWPDTFIFLALFQGPLALAAFLAGIAAARTDFFAKGSLTAGQLKGAVLKLLGAGLVLNMVCVLGAMRMEENSLYALLSLVVLPVAAPILSAAYLGLILLVVDRFRLPKFVVLAGQNSLTSYVAQGVIAGLIMGGYGLGLYNTLGQMALLVISILIALLSMALTASFASKFGHGPLELALRRVTYS
jgi:uncharacterized protein